MSIEVKSYAPHELRVIQERVGLINKIHALETFIGTPFFKTLDATQTGLLVQQLDAMKAYDHILSSRISYF